MTPKEIEQRISDLEKEVDRLNALYNQYFMGIEKVEPTVARKNLDRKIHLLRREQIRNTALRFRLQMQIQRYNTQSTYWNRICRQIENGTYKRQVMLAKKRVADRHQHSDIPPARAAKPPGAAADTDDLAHDLDLDGFGDAPGISSKTGGAKPLTGSAVDNLDDPFADLVSSERAALPPRRPAPPPGRGPVSRGPIPPKRPAPSSPQDAEAEKLKTVYRRYLAARKKCNEPTKDITYQLVASTLMERMSAAGRDIDFKVVIRGGKAMIKAVKKGD